MSNIWIQITRSHEQFADLVHNKVIYVQNLSTFQIGGTHTYTDNTFVIVTKTLALIVNIIFS